MLKLPKLSTTQIDQVNIGLMIISLILAYILPFEVFLFSYAVLGPLHYLTEISWLHQKNYFVPNVKKLSLWIFPILALILTIILVYDDVEEMFRKWQHLPELKEKTFAHVWNTNLIFFLFALSLILVFIPKVWMKVVGIAALLILCISMNLGQTCLSCTSKKDDSKIELCDFNKQEANKFIRNQCKDVNGNGSLEYGEDFSDSGPRWAGFTFFITAYLPTLIHVYLFTMLFMLFGALKAKSKTGIVSVIVLIICGSLPFIFDPPFLHYTVSEGARKSYDASFLSLNQIILDNFTKLAGTPENVYGTRIGIMLTRFIAFAYTYHYLNWFSKTSIIQWHKMRGLNLGIVLVLWVISVALYYYDYKTGLTMLLLLSFLHVFLEFPLNYASFKGIVLSLFGKKKAAAA